MSACDTCVYIKSLSKTNSGVCCQSCSTTLHCTSCVLNQITRCVSCNGIYCKACVNVDKMCKKCYMCRSCDHSISFEITDDKKIKCVKCEVCKHNVCKQCLVYYECKCRRDSPVKTFLCCKICMKYRFFRNFECVECKHQRCPFDLSEIENAEVDNGPSLFLCSACITKHKNEKIEVKDQLKDIPGFTNDITDIVNSYAYPSLTGSCAPDLFSRMNNDISQTSFRLCHAENHFCLLRSME